MIRSLVAIVLIASASCFTWASGHVPGKADKIDNALASGRPLVIALIEQFPAPMTASETYADWAAYLNAFAAHLPCIVVVALNRSEAARILESLPPLVNGYATVFIRPDGKAVVYEGPILEKAVYNAATSYLKTSTTTNRDMFDPFSVRLQHQSKNRSKTASEPTCDHHELPAS